VVFARGRGASVASCAPGNVGHLDAKRAEEPGAREHAPARRHLGGIEPDGFAEPQPLLEPALS